MALSNQPDEPFGVFWADLEKLRSALTKNKAVNVNSRPTRDLAHSLSQSWFRTIRPIAASSSVAEEHLVDLDSCFQQLLRLSTGNNARSSYLNTTRSIRTARAPFEAALERARGASSVAAGRTAYAPVEQRILTTLQRMLPDSALSYEQALVDIGGLARLSYRGTATELREVVREVLDHLAPDKDVAATPGFKLEKDRHGPTMKQKARHILRARGYGDTARKAPEEAVTILEDHIAAFARSTYERGSVATHGATTLQDAQRFKGYADAILAELLQVH